MTDQGRTEQGRTEQAAQSPKIVATPVRRHVPSNILLSIVLLVLSLGGYLIGAVFDIIAAFAGHQWVNPAALIGGGAILALIAVIGAAVTVFLLVQRRRAWPVALATLVVVLLGWIVVFVLFAFAIV